MNLEFSEKIFEKVTNIKFHQNPSCGSQVVPCGRTDRQTESRTNTIKLIVAFSNFANVPKNAHISQLSLDRYDSTATSIFRVSYHYTDVCNWPDQPEYDSNLDPYCGHRL